MSRPPVVWTIAGSDSGGGAGVQADLHALHTQGVHGCSVVTATTAQSSCEVRAVQVVSADHVAAQLHTLAADMPPDAIKIGMVGSPDNARAIAAFLDGYDGPVVCDPVLRTTTGAALADEATAHALLAELVPRATLVTPNLPEAELLTGRAIRHEADMAGATSHLRALGARAALLKGGHDVWNTAVAADHFDDGERPFWLCTPRQTVRHDHGTGCTLASVLAASLATRWPCADAAVIAKGYVSQGLRHARAIGAGPGPVAHHPWPGELVDLPAVYFDAPRAAHTTPFPACGTRALGVYPCVDSAAWLERLLPLGVPSVQLRIKDASQAVLQAEIATSVTLARRYGARLFINDHWRLAIEAGAHGVHLGQDDLATADLEAIASAGLALGVSTHSYFEIARAHGIGPSYIALGPIYATTTKPMRFAPQGLDQLRVWARLLQCYPLVAIGGLNAERIPAALGAGTGCASVVRAITEAADPDAATRELLAVVEACTPSALRAPA